MRGVASLKNRVVSASLVMKRLTAGGPSNRLLLTWLKKRGLDDALIQPYTGHAPRKSLEVYSQLALADAQASYKDVMDDFPGRRSLLQPLRNLCCSGTGGPAPGAGFDL